MEKERSLKEIVVNIMRKKQGYTSDLGGFYFLAEDFFSVAAEEIVAELKKALKKEFDSKYVQSCDCEPIFHWLSGGNDY